MCLMWTSKEGHGLGGVPGMHTNLDTPVKSWGWCTEVPGTSEEGTELGRIAGTHTDLDALEAVLSVAL